MERELKKAFNKAERAFNKAIGACQLAHVRLREFLCAKGVKIDEWDFDHSNLEIRMWVPTSGPENSPREQETHLLYGFGGGKLYGSGTAVVTDKVSREDGKVEDRHTLFFADANGGGNWREVEKADAAMAFEVMPKEE